MIETIQQIKKFASVYTDDTVCINPWGLKGGIKKISLFDFVSVSYQIKLNKYKN